jgi:hypothetical protein
MNKRYGFRRPDRWDASRRNERMRFVGSAIGLWAVCASGIYLIGPGDMERMSAAGLPAHAMTSAGANASIAAYRQ